mgnify:CR=1 FL=1
MKLLEPIKVGNIEFKNRIMFPPLTTGYEEKDGSIGEQSFSFLRASRKRRCRIYSNWRCCTTSNILSYTKALFI